MKGRFWDRYQSWEEAEAAWDAIAAKAAIDVPLKAPVFNPSILPIAPGEGEMRWKAFRWVIRKDGGYRLIGLLLRHPFRYARQFLLSAARGKPYHKDGDLFLYGVKSLEELQTLMTRDDVLLIVGFSYCEKPYECPSGRFNDCCDADLCNPVCQQCFIGKVMHSLPRSQTLPVVIPTINAIGSHVLEVIKAFPKHQVLFVITACEMALEMFGDFGNMVGIRGVGIRLGGRVCNTMRAFALSEEGIKPGLTAVPPSAERRILDLLRFWSKTRADESSRTESGEECCDSIRP